MADPILQVGTLVWLGGYDMSGQLNRANVKASRQELPDGRFPDDIAATYPGIQMPDVALEGLWSAGAGEPDTVTTGARIITKDASEWPLTILPSSAPGAAGANGNVAYNLRSAQFASYFGAEHGRSLPFRLSNKGRTGRLDRLTVIHPKAVYVATGNGAAHQLGALSASQKLVVVLHVFSVVGGTWTVTIESDNASNFPTPITRATFTGATGITRQVLEVAGAVTDDWWRAVVTETVGGTDVTLAVLAGITPV